MGGAAVGQSREVVRAVEGDAREGLGDLCRVRDRVLGADYWVAQEAVRCLPAAGVPGGHERDSSDGERDHRQAEPIPPRACHRSRRIMHPAMPRGKSGSSALDSRANELRLASRKR
jgi:hypothetical protein